MPSIEVDHEQLTELVRQSLMESLEVIEFLAQPEDIKLWHGLKEVIEYYSTPEQIEKFHKRESHEHWQELLNETT